MRYRVAERAIPAAGAPHRGETRHWRATFYRWYASVYRLLKAHDLIASPAFFVIKAAERSLAAAGSGLEPHPRTSEPTLSPRELAVRFSDTQSYFVSEALNAAGPPRLYRSYREHVRHSAAPHNPLDGLPVEPHRARDGLQAGRSRAGKLAAPRRP
jgi:hypothetical protein